MKIASVCGLIVILSCLGGPAFGETPWPESEFEQKEFVISGWGDMTIDGHAPQNYADMANAHFNVVLNFFVRDKLNSWGGAPGHIGKQLDIAQQNGMKVLVYVGEEEFGGGSDSEVLDSVLTDHPACMGYFLHDEPHASRFSKIADQVHAIRKHRPGKLAFVNLHPSAAFGDNQEAYNEYLEDYVTTTKADVLCADRYPRFFPGKEDDGRDGYCENLSAVREMALKYDIPFWWFFYSTPHLEGELQEPTAGQLRWQMYTAVTYGAKGLLYFTYWRAPFSGERFKKDSALVDSRYTKNRLYEKAKRTNFRISNLGPTLMKLRSTDVFRVQAEMSSDLPGVQLSKVEEDDPDLNLLVGVFEHEDGRSAFMMTNYEHAYTMWVTLKPGTEDVQIFEVDPASGKEISVYDESPRLDGIQISFDSGEGRLFMQGKI